MPMEQWPGPSRDEDGWAEADEDEPGDWLTGSEWEPARDEAYPDEHLAGPIYWMLRDWADREDKHAPPPDESDGS